VRQWEKPEKTSQARGRGGDKGLTGNCVKRRKKKKKKKKKRENLAPLHAMDGGVENHPPWRGQGGVPIVRKGQNTGVIIHGSAVGKGSGGGRGVGKKKGKIAPPRKTGN